MASRLEIDEELNLSLDDLTNDNFDLSPCMLSMNKTNSSVVMHSEGEEDLTPKTSKPVKTTTKQARQVYLITYSQADVLKVPSRSMFADLVCKQFNRNDDVVDRWASSIELHRKSGVHYHLALKLKKDRRFNEVRKNIVKEHNINLDFKEWHDNYYTAYTYVKKFDSYFETSEGHPILDNPPSTTKATAAKRALSMENSCTITSAKKTNTTKEFKEPRLNNETVGAIILQNKLKSDKQLYAFARAQAKEGKMDLQSYLYKHPNPKSHTDLITTVWRIENSEETLDRDNKTRLEILQEAKLKGCSEEGEKKCAGSWFKAAVETLENNGIEQKRFSGLVLNSIINGRGKGRNVMICGPTNCAKSFMLMPLTKIYNCFMTPSQGTYNWVDAPDKELIFLNDLRYDLDGEKKVLPWNLFLNLLEGVTVNISRPKNFYSKDFEWVEKQPIFATADKPIIRINNGRIDTGETDQMAERWIILPFTHQYQGKNVNYDLVPCGSCFAKLILDA